VDDVVDSRLAAGAIGQRVPTPVDQRTPDDLAMTFAAAGKDTSIAYVDTPEAIRDRYQYFTEAKMDRTARGWLGHRRR
jgi:hypothetical protein